METLPDVASRSATHSTPSGSEAAPIADRFRLRSKLGEGATGEVWRADDLHRGGAATIKLLRAELTHDPAVARRFLREARTLQHLAHPHLPVILDAGHDTVTGRYFLAQPYLEAETLRAVVERDAPMAWDDAAAILYPLMSALAAAHVAGVIHRDVKPENILVGRRDGAPHPLLIDFGMCKRVTADGTQQTRSGVVMGTPAYMAPEQAAGERDLDARADIWSVAAVWFELLTGTPPFVDALPGRLLARVITEDSPPIALSRPDLPAWRCEAIDRALARSPSRRFDSMESFSAALRAPPPGGSTVRRQGALLLRVALIVALLPSHAATPRVRPPAPQPAAALRRAPPDRPTLAAPSAAPAPAMVLPPPRDPAPPRPTRRAAPILRPYQVL